MKLGRCLGLTDSMMGIGFPGLRFYRNGCPQLQRSELEATAKTFARSLPTTALQAVTNELESMDHLCCLRFPLYLGKLGGGGET